MDSLKFVDMSAEALRTYMADHKERDYVLIDVRQPKEYAQAHIPGAHLASCLPGWRSCPWSGI